MTSETNAESGNVRLSDGLGGRRRNEMKNWNLDCMSVGDAVEFSSDRQTEKGPSSGRVTARDGNKVCIRHSDHPGEMFYLPSLLAERIATHHKGGRLWVLL